MRILMLSQFYAPIVGGEERIVQDLSFALSRRGHAVAVATQWRQDLPEYVSDRGVEVFRIRSLAQRAGWLFREPDRRHTPPWPDPEAVLSLRRVLAQHRPEIVHAHNWLVHSFLPLKNGSGARLLLSLHDYSLVCANKRLMRRQQVCSGPHLRKCLACAGDHYGMTKGLPTALGHWAMLPFERAAVDMFLPVRQAVAHGSGLTGGPWPYQVMPNFVPDQRPDNATVDPALLAKLPPNGFVMFAGDLSREKGIDVLLQAYAGLSGAPPIVVIGRHHPQAPLAPSPNVVILEKWPHAAVLEAWRRCSLAVVPSVWAEPFGLVALEAMAAGQPVIASDVGGLSDVVIKEQTGLLVPPGDVMALRTALARLLASPDLRTQMGHAGQRRAEEFRASRVVPRLEGIYQSVLAAKPGRQARRSDQAEPGQSSDG